MNECEDYPEDMGVEIIPRKKKRRQSYSDDTPRYLRVPHMHTSDQTVEISMEEISTKAPPAKPKVPRVRMAAGTVLQPPGPAVEFVRPTLRRKEDQQPITYVVGEPFPPSFRVIGLCDQEQQQRPDSPSSCDRTSELCIKRLPLPKNRVNISSSSALTDEDEADVLFSRKRDEYLQLDIPSKPNSFGEMHEVFHDEEVLPIETDKINESVDASNTTTRNYRLFIASLRASSRSSVTRTSNMLLKPPLQRSWGSFGGYGCVIFLAFILVLGTSLLVISLTTPHSNAQANAIQGNSDAMPDLGEGMTPPQPPNTQIEIDTSSHAPTNQPLHPSDFPEATKLIVASNNPNSPQVKAYRWLLSDPMIHTYPLWRQFQRMALATLYYSTKGHSWKHTSNWLSYESECTWFSQACDSMGHIRRILLPSSNLQGSLPAELFWLTSLQQIQVYDNPGLHGSLHGIGSLTDLAVLWIQGCSFSATEGSAFPPEIGRLTSLLYLDASSNPLGRHNITNGQNSYDVSRGSTPDLPSQLGLLTNLKELVVAEAHLGGSLPTQFGNLIQLEALQINGNALNGLLPKELGLLSKLTHLSAQENFFSGSLPTEYSKWTSMKVLDLSVNHFEGDLPKTWSSMESIEELWMYDNMLSGGFPADWGIGFARCQSLDLSMNALVSIPAEIGGLTSIRGLWLYQNRIMGTLPMTLGSLHQHLLQLSLFGNDLSGSIPAALGALTKMRGLWLDENSLSGSIPPLLFMSTKLMSLHLFSNKLQGSLPQIPSGNPYYAFQEIRLENNHLTGQIPPSLLNLHSNLAVLNLQENEITGTIPTQLAALTSLNELTLQRNELTGAVPWELCAAKISAVQFLDLVVDCNEVICDCGCTCPVA